ncbi:hypothetical protein [Desulfallas thermosapovorans]|uniref:DUF1440 domain-containing protein n=1 Tax=Desulfallas thermosapovorans DSM 6562 TaxID=1121431 RepID=A0A5S4ZMW0_9FIRM|nr:hypothetical protein [Desulfallas thermosapovorans]TYO91690.1 hypothetical protein LX24_02965 [Desulfallas thermosapovorans DSM 6562]
MKIKIKDRVLLGVVSGVLAGMPSLLLNIYEHKKGLVNMTYPQSAGTLSLKKSRINTIEGKIISHVTNAIGMSSSGVATTYIMSSTGRDHPILKGIGVHYLYGVILAAILPKFGLVAKVKPKFPVLGLIEHTISGVLCGLLVARLGDDSLFPDKRTSIDEKTYKKPVVNIKAKNSNI